MNHEKNIKTNGMIASMNHENMKRRAMVLGLWFKHLIETDFFFPTNYFNSSYKVHLGTELGSNYPFHHVLELRLVPHSLIKTLS